MEILFSQRIRERYPLAKIACAQLTDLDNRGTRELRKEIRALRSHILANKDSIFKNLERYRKFFGLHQRETGQRRFIPHEPVLPALQARIEEFLEGKEFVSAGPLEDCLTLASMQTGIFLWALDTDHIKEPVTLDQAREGELMVDRTGEEIHLEQGDLVLRDQRGIVWSFLNGPAERVKPHRDMKSALLFAPILPEIGISAERIKATLKLALEDARVVCRASSEPLEIHIY